MKKNIIFLYGVICYIAFLLTFLYAIGFIGNMIVPKTIDSKPSQSFVYALLINIGLLLIFALQHSIMARRGFKRWWTQYIPIQAERSTYVLFSSIALFFLFWFWEPMGGIIWDIQNASIRITIQLFYLIGPGLVVASSFMINHFDLFGLRQVYMHWIGKPYTSLQFEMPNIYKFIRHPLYVGWFITFWFTPTMTATHFLFALMMTGYIQMAIPFEERDLIRAHGEKYIQYRKQVPMFFPMRMHLAKDESQKFIDDKAKFEANDVR